MWLAARGAAAPLLDGVGRNVPVTTYNGREKDIAAAEKFQAWLESTRQNEGMSMVHGYVLLTTVCDKLGSEPCAWNGCTFLC